MRKALIISIIIMYYLNSYSINVNIQIDSISCFGGNDGKIIIQIDSLNPNMICKLFDISRDSTKNNLVYKNPFTSNTLVIKDLLSSEYILEIHEKNLVRFKKKIRIDQPDKLRPGKIEIEKGLNNETEQDAILVARPQGGSKPYTFIWSENTHKQKNQKATNLGQGTYFCEINDANNCGPVRATIFFNRFVFPDHIKTHE